MSKRRIYLSGGMSGIPRSEYQRKFREAERILHRHGYGVINPCRVWACRWPWIYKAMEYCLGHSKAYALILAYDLLLLMTRADGIAMLPGWEQSRGARIENYTARHFPMMGISRQAAEEIDNIK